MSSIFQESVAQSLLSMKSQEIIDTASRISRNNNFGLKTEVADDELISKCWGAFGLYISRQMRMGRGILIPHFGTFSFSAPGVLLDGVTNPLIRDKQNRQPVFLVSKDFANGKNLKTGIYIDNHIRPFVNQTSGKIQQTKINYAEIAQYVQQNKDVAKYSIERMIRVIADRCRKDQNVDMQIPGVGNFHVKSNMVAVHFDSQFINQTQGIPKRPISERRQIGNMALTQENLQSLNFGSTLKKTLPTLMEESGKQFLERNLDINIDDMKSMKNFYTRPISAGPRKNQNMQKSLLERSIGAPQLIRPDTIGNLQSFKKNISDLEYGLKMIYFWIRQNRYNSEDAYIECCNNAFGRTKDKKIKMNLQQFTLACHNMELGLSEQQVIELFNHLDINKDGLLNYFDWIQTIKDNNVHLNYIRDAVFKNNLHSDDVLKTMGFHREHPPVNLSQLKQGLLNLDLILDSKQAETVSQQLLNGRDKIEMSELIETFDCIEEEDKIFDASWFKDILFKIKEKMVNSKNYNALKKLFEENDDRNLGCLQTNDFKKCLMKSSLKLSVIDINRIVRYLPKARENMIDYYQFLRQIDRIDVMTTSDQKVGDIYEFAEKMSKYLKDNKLTIELFLKNVRNFAQHQSYADEIGSEGQVTIEQVTEYLLKYIFLQTSRYNIENYVKEIDIDSDGYILDNDMGSFLEKYNYFEMVYFTKCEPTRDLIRNKSYQDNKITLNTKGLFPTDRLPESKIDKILRDLRRNLEIKKIGFSQFFQMIDNDKDGFITIQEFSDSIEKVLSLSQYIKDGLFAYIDKLHIGMIDYTFFLKFLNKSVTYPEVKLKHDSFDWQYAMIMKIREWFAKEKLTVEDAFKTLDKHYRGEIRENDLYEFLREQIKVKEEELSLAKVNRLFKLMDQFKKGSISCEDFRRFLCEDFTQGAHQCIMGHQVIDNFSSFDWKLNARQQVGLVLTRRFKDLQHSYNSIIFIYNKLIKVISGYRKKLLYKQFRTWIYDTNCLNGFDISETQLQELYADFDTHKKGFLTETDWITAFKGFNWKNQMIEEMKEVLNTNFESLKKAFDFFVKSNKSDSFDFNTFKTSLDYLLPKRFIESDVYDLWKILSDCQDRVNFQQFESCFGRNKGIYSEAYLDINQQSIENQVNLEGKSLKFVEEETPVTFEAPFKNESLLDRVRRYLRASNKQIEVELQKADKDGTGILTNLQFRKVLKIMNFGLKQDEIDELLNICSQEGQLVWRNFLKMISLRDSDLRIIDRAKIKLQHFTQLIYTYMLSPKDAFRIFDVNSKGILDFDQFQSFIQELTHLSGEQMPPYSIIKDMFDFLDKKRDGIIDLAEWMDAFSQYEYQAIASVPKRNIQLQTEGGRPEEDNYRLNTLQESKKPSKFRDTKKHTNINFKERPFTANFQVKKINYNENSHQPILLRESIISESNQKIMEQKMGEWESSKEFDKALTAIGRNRKFLFQMFQQISKRTVLTYPIVKQIIEQMLRNSGVTINEEAWPCLIKFTEKDGVIDYKFLLDVYKERIQRIDSHPIQNHKIN